MKLKSTILYILIAIAIAIGSAYIAVKSFARWLIDRFFALFSS